MNAVGAGRGGNSFMRLLTVATLLYGLGSAIFVEPGASNNSIYLAIGAYTLFALHVVIRGMAFHRAWTRDPLFYAPAMVVLAWVYGVLLGFWRGNATLAVVSNFAGMALFGLFYLGIQQRISKDGILRLLKFLAIVTLAWEVYRWSTATYDTALIAAIGFTGLRTTFSVATFITYPFLAMLVFYTLHDPCPDGRAFRRVFWGSLGQLVYLGAFVVALASSGSKGFVLAALFAVTVPVAAGFLANPGAFRTTRLLAAAVALVVAGVVLMNRLSVLQDIVSTTLSMELDTESARSQQAKMIWAEIVPFGRGLGAALESGYSRDLLGYGFELTYHSIIHKLGVVSLLVFGAYGLILYRAVRNIVLGRDRLYAIAAFAIMSHVAGAYGNPFLFAPVMVMLTCLAIVLLLPSAASIPTTLPDVATPRYRADAITPEGVMG